MARRVKQTSSRGSTLQHSQRLSGDVMGRSPPDSIDELEIAQRDREEAWTADHIEATPIAEAQATDLEPQRLSNGIFSPLESSDSADGIPPGAKLASLVIFPLPAATSKTSAAVVP